MFQQLFWHILDLECTLKHCSSNHNTSMILKFRKRVSRLVTTGAINVKEKPSEGGHIIVQRIPLTQVQMLKSFNSLLIKFNVSTQETSCQNFFPAHCTCMNFFWDNSLVQEFFSYTYALAEYFFSKSPNPPFRS